MRMTLFGMYQYDPTLLDGVQLPAIPQGDEMIELDSDLMKREIIREAGELYPFWQVPDMVKQAITDYFLKQGRNIYMRFRALYAEYNPIENYDRYESTKDNHTNSGSDVTAGEGSNANESSAESVNVSEGQQIPNLTTENKVSAFDSDSYQPSSTTIQTGNQKTTQEDGSNSSATSASSYESKSTLTHGHVEDMTHEARIHGNIGVTTSAQMIEGELKLRSIDLYRVIALELSMEICLNMY